MRLDTFVEAMTFEDWNRPEGHELTVEEKLIRRLLAQRFTEDEILAALVEPEIFAAKAKA